MSDSDSRKRTPTTKMAALQQARALRQLQLQEQSERKGERQSSSSGDEADQSESSHASNAATPPSTPLRALSRGPSEQSDAGTPSRPPPSPSTVAWNALNAVQQLSEDFHQLRREITKQHKRSTPEVILEKVLNPRKTTPTSKKASKHARRKPAARNLKKELQAALASQPKTNKSKLFSDGGTSSSSSDTSDDEDADDGRTLGKGTADLSRSLSRADHMLTKHQKDSKGAEIRRRILSTNPSVWAW